MTTRPFAAISLALTFALVACASAGHRTAPDSPEHAALAALDFQRSGPTHVVLVDTLVRGLSGIAVFDPLKFPVSSTLSAAEVGSWRTSTVRFAPFAFDYRSPGADTAAVTLARDLTRDQAEPARTHFVAIVLLPNAASYVATISLERAGDLWKPAEVKYREA
jgi:hypothetical protein